MAFAPVSANGESGGPSEEPLDRGRSDREFVSFVREGYESDLQGHVFPDLRGSGLKLFEKMHHVYP